MEKKIKNHQIRDLEEGDSELKVILDVHLRKTIYSRSNNSKRSKPNVAVSKKKKDAEAQVVRQKQKTDEAEKLIEDAIFEIKTQKETKYNRRINEIAMSFPDYCGRYSILIFLHMTSKLDRRLSSLKG